MSAAREPGALPLLSFLLDELSKKDVVERHGSKLTYETAQALGGLQGAIATRAEETFAALAPNVQAAFPNVFRALVTVSGDRAEPTTRAAALAQFVLGSPERALVDRLLDPQIRLEVADGDGEGAYVRLDRTSSAQVSACSLEINPVLKRYTQR
jgi:hypothetical protein